MSPQLSGKWKEELRVKNVQVSPLEGVDLQGCKSHTFVSSFILTQLFWYITNEYGEPILKKRPMSKKRI